ncbi:hypothetical protein NDU88_004635 [Pleurodeles waltl]|uniref:Uncharacterized protein n=1 Tax=Pleurodeles waltl TaxID=8319 RepID=A0AAV7V591_PLEWA|nr:hypothetical protein NDU88_004635 [Pleurodeles waltl]
MFGVCDPGCLFVLIFSEKPKLHTDFLYLCLYGGSRGFDSLEDNIQFISCSILGPEVSWLSAEGLFDSPRWGRIVSLTGAAKGLEELPQVPPQPARSVTWGGGARTLGLGLLPYTGPPLRHGFERVGERGPLAVESAPAVSEPFVWPGLLRCEGPGAPIQVQRGIPGVVH